MCIGREEVTCHSLDGRPNSECSILDGALPERRGSLRFHGYAQSIVGDALLSLAPTCIDCANAFSNLCETEEHETLPIAPSPLSISGTSASRFQKEICLRTGYRRLNYIACNREGIQLSLVRRFLLLVSRMTYVGETGHENEPGGLHPGKHIGLVHFDLGRELIPIWSND